MAQAKLTEFFTARKRNAPLQPSKRRKLQHNDSEQTTTEQNVNSKLTSDIVAPIASKLTDKCDNKSHAEATAGAAVTRTRKTRSSSRHNSRVGAIKVSTRTKSAAIVKSSDDSGLGLGIILPNADGTDSTSGSVSSDSDRSESSGSGRCLDPVPDSVATAACDDHCASPSSTPTKRSTRNAGLQQATSSVAGKRSRRTKVVRRDLLSELNKPDKTPESEKGFDFALYVKSSVNQKTSSRSRRKLLLPKSVQPPQCSRGNTDGDSEVGCSSTILYVQNDVVGS